VRAAQGDVEAERLGCLEIQDQLEFRGLLDRKVAGLGALENLVDDERHVAAVDGVIVRRVGHEPTGLHMLVKAGRRAATLLVSAAIGIRQLSSRLAPIA
jgi:hypothetical protein